MEIKKVLEELDRMSRKGGNSRSAMFAKRAYQAIVNAYETYQCEPVARENVSAETLAKADKLIEMGAIEAAYGRGRALLH